MVVTFKEEVFEFLECNFEEFNDCENYDFTYGLAYDFASYEEVTELSMVTYYSVHLPQQILLAYQTSHRSLYLFHAEVLNSLLIF
jgi:hypothetical protein